jgi:type II secretory pathway pseudopilin PulG
VSIRALRRGISLIEVVVVVVLLGVIGGAVASALLHQQRFAGDTTELINARYGVRDATEVISTDIRGSSSADTIRLMADSAIELFAGIGTSVVCRTASSSTFALAEESPENALSSFLLYPDTGDIALLYRDSADAVGSHWERNRIAAFGPSAANAGCLLYGMGPAEGFMLTLREVPHSAVKPGTPVRFIRRGRYSLYRSSDAEWYLGYRRCNASGPAACGTIQPVSGPYKRYSSDGSRTGFLFEFFDARGDRVTGNSPLAVARVDVSSRAESRKRRRIGETDRPIAASAAHSVAIRNR